MITAGAPGSETPIVFCVGLCSCRAYQMEGSVRFRCGSLAKMGYPLAVLRPLTAQLLLPLSGWGWKGGILSTVAGVEKEAGCGTTFGVNSHVLEVHTTGSV